MLMSGGAQMQGTGGAQMLMSGGGAGSAGGSAGAAGGSASGDGAASASVVVQGGQQCHERHEGTSFQPPMFVKPLECIHCEIGQTVTFEGKVVGIPEPTIVWTKEGASLEKAANISIKNSAGGMVTLTVA